ncbi:transposase [Sulfitobacter sp. W002]|uniref:REP-associated tyrosine transposase n=1 Tax=Sulfitobacter sp. W002 TaxID=2867024 RepID=UPI0021A86CA0|nr:transposase [Sulfitobacter sp. W002]UWR28983.1 transposase [Sulfitobacter sp. W002]
MRDRISSHGPNCYFFTLRLARGDDDALLRHITALRQAMRETLARKPFRIDAIAILPDVLHMVWTLPPNDTDYGNRIGMWKGRFSRHLPPAPHRSLRQIKRGEKGIWQRRFWEHRIRDHADFERHCGLVHLSPVHAGYCDRPEAWPYSSYSRNCSGPPAPQGAEAGPLEKDAVLDDDVTPLNHAAQAVAPFNGLHS